MKQEAKNYAFIDSQNVNLAVREQGWALDFARFRKYLKEKYSVSQVYLFIGYIEGNQDLYTHLQKMSYICIFKPTLKYKDGTTKGNCDAELVLQAMIELPNYEKAVIVTGDGDVLAFAGLILVGAFLGGLPAFAIIWFFYAAYFRETDPYEIA